MTPQELEECKNEFLAGMIDHTPGPWSVSDKYSPCLVSAPQGRSICSTGGYSDSRIDPEQLSSENAANARLIAAAPDLLEACIAVAASAMRNAAYDACVAAIAKATGNEKG